MQLYLEENLLFLTSTNFSLTVIFKHNYSSVNGKSSITLKVSWPTYFPGRENLNITLMITTSISVLDLILFYVKDSKSYSSVHPLKNLEWNTMDNWRDLWVCLSASEEFVTHPYSQQWLTSKCYTVPFFHLHLIFLQNKFISVCIYIKLFFKNQNTSM